MKTFKKHLNSELNDKQFRESYQEEKELLDIAFEISERRNKLGLSQKELSQKAHITQQQLSKVESGVNCNMTTFLKVCHALNLTVGLKKLKA